MATQTKQAQTRAPLQARPRPDADASKSGEEFLAHPPDTRISWSLSRAG